MQGREDILAMVKHNQRISLSAEHYAAYYRENLNCGKFC